MIVDSLKLTKEEIRRGRFRSFRLSKVAPRSYHAEQTMRPALIMLALLAVAAGVAFFGTIQALEKGTRPRQYSLHLRASGTNYVVRVTWPATNEFPISQTGNAIIDIPALPRGCSLICLGVKLREGSSRSRKVVDVVRGDRVVRRLSVQELDDLSAKGSGTVRLDL